MSATDEELRNADSLGVDHVTYALFDFSLSFLIYLVITFLVHLYSNSGRNALQKANNGEEIFDSARAEEHGYAKVPAEQGEQRGEDDDSHEDGPEAYEMADRDSSGESDAVKIGGEDEVDWMGRRAPVSLQLS